MKNVYVCSSQQMEAPVECIKQLMDGETGLCSTEHTYGRNIVSRIDESNIMVNEANMTVRSNCSSQDRRLIGSFLIQYMDCTISLDGNEYTNTGVRLLAEPLIPTTGLKVNSTRFINQIPLEQLQELHLEQREMIRHLNLSTLTIGDSIQLSRWLSFGSLSMLPVIIVGLIVYSLFLRKHPRWFSSVATSRNQHQNDSSENQQAGTHSNEERKQRTLDLMIPQP